MPRRPLGVVLAVLTVVLGACSQHGLAERFRLTPDHILVERRPDPRYDQLFPYYVELCATSQFRSSDKGRGGVTGHAVMYLTRGATASGEAPLWRPRG